MLQEGDKVSFVNEKQDGIVIKIKENGIVVVEIEDGFSLEVSKNELVKIQQSSAFSKAPESGSPVIKEISKPEIPDLIKILSMNKEVNLVAIPESGKVLSGDTTYFLSNNSQQKILFTFSFRKGRVVDGKSMGLIEPFKSVELVTVSHDLLMDVDLLIIELLIYKDGEHDVYPRIYKELAVELPGINQTFSKAPAPLSFAVVRSLISFEETPEVEMQELFDKYKADQPVTLTPIKTIVLPPSKHRPDTTLKDFGLSPSQFEVDLHIEELLDQTVGMSSSEMIGIQLKHFQKELDKAMMNKSAKIVFIHGVGNGRLKNAIRDELTSLNIKFRDASYEKYGSGATEVFLK